MYVEIDTAVEEMVGDMIDCYDLDGADYHRLFRVHVVDYVNRHMPSFVRLRHESHLPFGVSFSGFGDLLEETRLESCSYESDGDSERTVFDSGSVVDVVSPTVTVADGGACFLVMFSDKFNLDFGTEFALSNPVLHVGNVLPLLGRVRESDLADVGVVVTHNIDSGVIHVRRSEAGEEFVSCKAAYSVIMSVVLSAAVAIGCCSRGNDDGKFSLMISAVLALIDKGSFDPATNALDNGACYLRLVSPAHWRKLLQLMDQSKYLTRDNFPVFRDFVRCVSESPALVSMSFDNLRGIVHVAAPQHDNRFQVSVVLDSLERFWYNGGSSVNCAVRYENGVCSVTRVRYPIRSTKLQFICGRPPLGYRYKTFSLNQGNIEYIAAALSRLKSLIHGTKYDTDGSLDEAYRMFAMLRDHQHYGDLIDVTSVASTFARRFRGLVNKILAADELRRRFETPDVLQGFHLILGKR